LHSSDFFTVCSRNSYDADVELNLRGSASTTDTGEDATVESRTGDKWHSSITIFTWSDGMMKVIYGLLFRASAETLLEVACDPRYLGAEIGFFSVLHTWSQRLGLHPHVHCVIPAGGLSPDHTHWIRSRSRFFLSIQVLRRVFRGKFVAGLKQAFQNGRLSFHGNLTPLAQPKIFAAWLRPLFRKDWVVYAKPPFGGPEYVLQYVAATPIAWPSPTIA
jgi:hypothetical protein